MGVRNYLIEGLSGSGKTTVAEELERRGFGVVHGDRQFAYLGDPQTGAPLDPPQDFSLGSEREAVAWRFRHWIWPEDRVRALIADRSAQTTFFCGGARNRFRFIDLFDAVFVLAVDRNTLLRRLAGRPDDEFGGKILERDFVLRLHASGEDAPANAVSIDATRPVAEVVDEILAWCRRTD